MLIEGAKPGVSVLSLCEKGDAFITAETGKVFKKEKEIKKGKNASERPTEYSLQSSISDFKSELNQ